MLSIKVNQYPNGREFVMACGDSTSMRALKIAYKKHVKGDESIGWEELSDILAHALAQTMGDEKFCEWLASL